YDYSDCFTPVADIISGADFAVVNLETPVAGGHYSGYPCFNAPDSYVEALRDAGFDLFLTANNHTLDRRDKGLKRTVALLDSLALPHLGTYPDSAARAKAIPFIRRIKGFDVGFLNYTYGTNGITVAGDAVVDYIDESRIRADVAATRNAGAEVIAACMHWGEEYTLIPVASERRLADLLTELGVDLIIGGHPHVVQPLEMRSNPLTGRPVFLVYSLGNFISNMKTTDTRGGMLASVTLSRDSVGNVVVTRPEYRYIYTVPPSDGQTNFQVYPLESVPDTWRSSANAFETNAERVFLKRNRGVRRTADLCE
ncbi:MAG: CapA family protein, partial [Muribaculaceae bacterium]|nr:CapA family protein [Muribaculaceae bacterium]